jgi:hypothetical protein
MGLKDGGAKGQSGALRGRRGGGLHEKRRMRKAGTMYTKNMKGQIGGSF